MPELSPSRRYVKNPLDESFFSSRLAIVDFPDPLKPVNHIIIDF